MSAWLASDVFTELAARWVPVWIDVAVKGLAILILASGAALLIRRASAAARHLVWLLAVASLAALPVLSFGASAWQWSGNFARQLFILPVVALWIVPQGKAARADTYGHVAFSVWKTAWRFLGALGR